MLPFRPWWPSGPGGPYGNDVNIMLVRSRCSMASVCTDDTPFSTFLPGEPGIPFSPISPLIPCQVAGSRRWTEWAVQHLQEHQAFPEVLKIQADPVARTKNTQQHERETHPQGNPHVFTSCAHRKQKDRSLLGIKFEYSTLDYTEVALRITAYTEVDWYWVAL